MSKVNFITLKWGKKYGPHYVNRLYRCLLKTFTGNFDFYCYTDNNDLLDKNIIVKDIEELRPEASKCFTIEKIYLFNKHVGNNVLLDLDILVLKDLNEYFQQYNFNQPRFILNHWYASKDEFDPEWSGKELCELYARMGSCYINSSFVTWKDDQLNFIVDFYNKHKKVIEFKLDDLDTFLFHGLRDQLDYHPKNIVYSYTRDIRYEVLKNFHIILFNTSHGTGRGKELDQTTDWANLYWKSFD